MWKCRDGRNLVGALEDAVKLKRGAHAFGAAKGGLAQHLVIHGRACEAGVRNEVVWGVLCGKLRMTATLAAKDGAVEMQSLRQIAQRGDEEL